MHVCPHCKEEVEMDELEEVFKTPHGCICEPRDWGDPDNIPPICNTFLPVSVIEIDICSHCEHERGCHS